MTDVHELSIRSHNMSRIRDKNTKPEILVRKFLYSKRFRYRLHVKKLPGKPDIVLKKYNAIIFINGCFWHKHKDCKYFVIPKTRTEWWLKKINKNVENDLKHISMLKNLGWNVIIIWECELKPTKRDKTLKNLVTLLKQ